MMIALLLAQATAPSAPNNNYYIAIGTAAGACIIQLLTWWQARNTAKVAKAAADAAKVASDAVIAAAKKAEDDRLEVKRKLEDQQSEIKKALDVSTEKVESKLDVVHGLSNSINIAHLRTIAMLARDKAESTRRQIDIDYADKADADLKRQEALQASLDPSVLVKADFPPSKPLSSPNPPA